jgi:hypothetical protein
MALGQTQTRAKLTTIEKALDSAEPQCGSDSHQRNKMLGYPQEFDFGCHELPCV